MEYTCVGAWGKMLYATAVARVLVRGASLSALSTTGQNVSAATSRVVCVSISGHAQRWHTVCCAACAVYGVERRVRACSRADWHTSSPDEQPQHHTRTTLSGLSFSTRLRAVLNKTTDPTARVHARETMLHGQKCAQRPQMKHASMP